MQNYIHPAVSAKKVSEYFRNSRKDNEEIHTLQIWQGDEMLLRVAPYPYSCEDRREIYSLSKTFCATAIGAACDEGLLTTDTRIVDIFPDKLPEEMSENLSKMKVSHVLSMNTGHESCVMPHMFRAEDPVAAFLALPIPYEPGTHFAYNTGASFLLSAIIKKVTGESLFDYLNRRILWPLGRYGLRWNISAGQLNEGGIGVQASSDDIAALGRLYLNKGIWNGKRLLSEKWVEEASSFHSDNSNNGSPDWCAGYGYQIWMMAKGGYRGDGAFGQLMIILPEKNRVIAVQGIVPDMQKEIDRVLELSDHLLSDDTAVTLEIPPFPPLTSGNQMWLQDAWYRTEENIFGWTMLHIHLSDDQTLCVDFSDGSRVRRFRAGLGRYAYSEAEYIWRKPKLLNLMDAHLPENIRTAACYSVEDRQCTIQSRHLCDPHTEMIRLHQEEDKLTLTFSVANGMLDERAKTLICHRAG